MSSMNHQLNATYGFVERNWNLTRRYIGWEIVWLVYGTVTTLTIGLIGVDSQGIVGQERVLYLLIGALLWSYLSVLFQIMGETVAWERWEGTIEYTLMAPVRRWVHLIGQTSYALLWSLITTIIIGTVTALFFEIDLSGANLGGALLVLLVGSISLTGVGIVASILPLMYPERGAQMTHIIQASFLLVSGVYYPVSVLPQWMQTLARLSPVTYVLDGIRGSIMEGMATADLMQYIWPLVLFGAITLPLGVWAFMRAEAYAKRTGRLKRVG